MNASIKRIGWLIRREIWESRLYIFVVPCIIGALSLAGLAFWLFAVVGHSVSMEINAVNYELSNLGNPAIRSAAVAALNGLLMGCHWVLFAYCAFAAALYSLNALYEDRVDRSILFWHSLPISDNETVLSKVLTALVVIPVVALVVSALMALGVVALFYVRVPEAGDNINLIWRGISKTYALAPSQMLGSLLSIAWLMFIGAISRSRPMVWAIFIPLLVFVTVLGFGSPFLGEEAKELITVVGSMLAFGLFPGWFVTFQPYSDIFEQQGAWAASMNALQMPALWIGVAAAVVLLIGAARVRNRSVEVL